MCNQGGPTGGSTLLLEWTDALSAKWTQQVAEASNADQLMEALVVLETSIDRDWVAAWFQHSRKHLLPLSRLFTHNTFASVGVRLFQLDAAIE